VPFREVNVAADQMAARELVMRTGQTGVPVIIAGNEVIVGFDRPRLERLAARMAPPPPPTPPDERPKLGLQVKDGSGGALVGAVREGSPSAQAGLRPGDIIEALNEKPVRSAADLENIAAYLRIGTPAAVEVRRVDPESGRSRRTRLRLPL
jgi:S1-C subfamily serine protease